MLSLSETSDERSKVMGSASSAVNHPPNDILNERLPDKSKSNTETPEISVLYRQFLC